MNKLMRTNTNKYRANIKAYILDCIELEIYENKQVREATESEKMLYVWDRFTQEYLYEFNIRKYKGNLYDILTQWLMGLPLNFDYQNYKILRVARQVHEVEFIDEKTEDKILKMWWSHLAHQILNLINANHPEKLNETHQKILSYRMQNMYSGNWSESV